MARLLRNHGSSPRAKYNNLMVGANSRLDAIQAAVIKVKLTYLDQWIKKRQRIAAYYNRKLSLTPEIITPYVDSNAKHSYHQYTIRVRKNRDKLQQHLNGRGLPTMIYYPYPLHKQPALKNITKNRTLPEAVKASKQVLSLPIYPELTKNEQNRIIKEIITFYAKHGK